MDIHEWFSNHADKFIELGKKFEEIKNSTEDNYVEISGRKSEWEHFEEALKSLGYDYYCHDWFRRTLFNIATEHDELDPHLEPVFDRAFYLCSCDDESELLSMDYMTGPHKHHVDFRYGHREDRDD